MIDEVAKELGLGINEEHDNAVLYSVMRIFLKRKAKKLNIDVNTLLLTFDEDVKCIEILRDYECTENQCIEWIENVKV